MKRFPGLHLWRKMLYTFGWLGCFWSSIEKRIAMATSALLKLYAVTKPHFVSILLRHSSTEWNYRLVSAGYCAGFNIWHGPACQRSCGRAVFCLLERACVLKYANACVTVQVRGISMVNLDRHMWHDRYTHTTILVSAKIRLFSVSISAVSVYLNWNTLIFLSWW